MVAQWGTMRLRRRTLTHNEAQCVTYFERGTVRHYA